MRRWRLLGLLLALLLAVGWWFFLISPRNTRIAEAREGLEVGRQQEVTLRGQIARLQEIRDAEVEYLAGIGKMEALIPERPLLDEFIEQIYELTGSTGVVLRSLEPDVPVVIEGSELRQIAVATTVEGDFFEVLGFLFGLTDLERLVRVDAIEVASAQDAAGVTVLTVSLSLRLFTLADLLPVADMGDAGGGTTNGGAGQATTTSTSAASTTTGEG